MKLYAITQLGSALDTVHDPELMGSIPGGSNLGCIVLLSKLYLNQKLQTFVLTQKAKAFRSQSH